MNRLLLLLILVSVAVLGKAQENLDTYVPVTDEQASDTYAVIIANEHYEFEVPVPYALNDGAIFKRYLEKTLGVPDKNIRFVPDATLNKMRRNLQWLSDMVSVTDGHSRVIVYYSGHGMPDKKIAELKAEEVLSGTLTKCSVKSGGAEIKSCFEKKIVMKVVTRAKKPGALERLNNALGI